MADMEGNLKRKQKRKRKESTGDANSKKKQKPEANDSLQLTGPIKNLQAMESYINASLTEAPAPDEGKSPRIDIDWKSEIPRDSRSEFDTNSETNAEKAFNILDDKIRQRVHDTLLASSVLRPLDEPLDGFSKLALGTSQKKNSKIPDTLGSFKTADEVSQLYHFNSTAMLGDKAHETATLLEDTCLPQETRRDYTSSRESNLFIKKSTGSLRGSKPEGSLRDSRSNLTATDGRRTILVGEAEDSPENLPLPLFNFEHLTQEPDQENSTLGQKVRQAINENLPFMNINSSTVRSDNDRHLASIVDWFTQNSHQILKSSEKEGEKKAAEVPKMYPVPQLPRTFTDNFDQGPVMELSQRPCINGLNCFSVVMMMTRIANGYEPSEMDGRPKNWGKEDLGRYILTEFLTPEMTEQRMRVILDNPHASDQLELINMHFPQVEMCIKCHRRVTSEMAIRYGACVGKIAPGPPVQIFGDIFDEPGEYNHTAQLAASANYTCLVKPQLRSDASDWIPVIKRVVVRYDPQAPNVQQKVYKPFPIAQEGFSTARDPNGETVTIRVPKNKYEMFASQGSKSIGASGRIVRDKTDDAHWELDVGSPVQTSLAHDMMRDPGNTSSQNIYMKNKSTRERYFACSVFGWVPSNNILYTQDKDPLMYRAQSSIAHRLDESTIPLKKKK